MQDTGSKKSSRKATQPLWFSVISASALAVSEQLSGYLL